MRDLIALCMAFYCLGALTVSLPTTIALIAEILLQPDSQHPNLKITEKNTSST